MIFLDFETRSEVDIRKTGAWVYSLHPSTEVLCLAAKYDDAEVGLVTGEQLREARILRQVHNSPLYKLIVNSDELFEAHNAFFEKAIWQNVMMKKYGWPEIPEHRWRCSASVAAYHALPRSLGGAGKALGLSTVKDDEGKRVMLQLSKPKPRVGGFISKEDSPEKFQILYDYCKSDVDAEHALAKKLGGLPERELKIWQLDQKINQRGVHVDREAVNGALKILNEYVAKMLSEVDEISEGAFSSINQRAKVIEWCKENGENMLSYDKAYVSSMVQKVKNQDVKRILEIRQALGKTSTAKYEAMANSMAPDNRIRDVLMYHGALTGRWSGKLVQFQNLPRGSIKDMDAAVRLIKSGSWRKIELFHGNVMNFMSSAIRGMICAPEGKMLVVSDFAAIEARVLGWMAGCEKMLNQFRNGEDLYKDMASKIYGVPVDQVTSDQRQLGKAAILGAGYGMGPDKFLQTCLSWGIQIDEELARTAIFTYRQTYKEVQKFWYDSEAAAHSAVRSRSSIKVGKTKWFMKDGFLKCELPSSRMLHYYQPKFEKNAYKDNFELTYLAEKMGKSFRTGTYGGKLVENIVQAVARDLMAEAMLRIEATGKFQVVLSIHDELVAEVDDQPWEPLWIENHLKEFESLMAETPDWAVGCPVSASGWVGKHYKK